MAATPPTTNLGLLGDSATIQKMRVYSLNKLGFLRPRSLHRSLRVRHVFY